MSRLAIITCGMGFGDEGKGASVDFLCRHYNASLVVRYSGGCQAGHNVQTEDGRRHTFSQFGSGTLCGVPTYLGQQMIVDPLAMVRESRHLIEIGVTDPFSTLTVHPKCLVTTEYTRRMNRWKAGKTKHSCGQGIGETRDYWLKYGNDSVFWEDLYSGGSELVDKLEMQRQRLLSSVNYACRDSLGYPSSREVCRGFRYGFQNQSTVAVSRECEWDGLAVFEGSQGVLIDETHGLGDELYRTFSDVTPHHAKEICVSVQAKSSVVGITRSYMTRHGDGPFPCVPIADMSDSGNPTNEWQGTIRFGKMNVDVLKYSAGIVKPDYLMVNHIDEHHYSTEEFTEIAPLLATGHGPAANDRASICDPAFW